MSRSMPSAYLQIVALGLVSGCAVWSPVTIGTDDPHPEPLVGSFRESDGTNEIVRLIREPGDGGELKVSGVPLVDLESAISSQNRVSTQSLLQQFEYCKLIAVSTVPSLNANASTGDDKATAARQPLPSEKRTLAGRVVSVDEDSIVLDEVVLIDESTRQTSGIPIVQKVPYVNRLFKNTGVSVQPVAIPGQVHVPLRDIQQVESVAATSWPSVQQNGFQRIGVDFDFTIPPQR